MTRLYLDTSPVIYAVEQVAPFATAVDARLAAAGVKPVVSDLTRMECRVKPLRNADAALLQDFDDWFSVVEVVSLSRAVLDRAADIRARHNFKTPDAIHLAAAVESACDAFYTHDSRLAKFTGVVIEVVRP